jgi:hypothetical protein
MDAECARKSSRKDKQPSFIESNPYFKEVKEDRVDV